jgi:hypothetical protein
MFSTLFSLVVSNWSYIATAAGGAAGFKAFEVALVAAIKKAKAWLAARAAKVEADAKADAAKAEADAKQLEALIAAHVKAALADVVNAVNGTKSTPPPAA